MERSWFKFILLASRLNFKIPHNGQTPSYLVHMTFAPFSAPRFSAVEPLVRCSCPAPWSCQRFPCFVTGRAFTSPKKYNSDHPLLRHLSPSLFYSPYHPRPACGLPPIELDRDSAGPRPPVSADHAIFQRRCEPKKARALWSRAREHSRTHDKRGNSKQRPRARS